MSTSSFHAYMSRLMHRHTHGSSGALERDIDRKRQRETEIIRETEKVEKQAERQAD